MHGCLGVLLRDALEGVLDHRQSPVLGPLFGGQGLGMQISVRISRGATLASSCRLVAAAHAALPASQRTLFHRARRDRRPASNLPATVGAARGLSTAGSESDATSSVAANAVEIFRALCLVALHQHSEPAAV